MTTYRVTMKIDFLVEITDENALADPRPPLQGDRPEAALNHANWFWLKSTAGMPKDLRKSLGIKRTLSWKKDWDVVRLDDQKSLIEAGVNVTDAAD